MDLLAPQEQADLGLSGDDTSDLAAHRHHREAAIQPSQRGGLPHPFQPRRHRLPVRRHQPQRRLQLLHHRLPHPAHPHAFDQDPMIPLQQRHQRTTDESFRQSPSISHLTRRFASRSGNGW
jgi:hypothetical protein